MLPVQPDRHEFARALASTGGARRAALQHARLSIGVGGLLGGTLLLAGNAVGILLGAASFSPVPLAANAALIFGGIMFLRERRRHMCGESERASL